MLKKFLSITVILSILFTFLSFNFGFTASAREKFKEGYYTYTVKNGEATITDCDNSISGDVIVPESLGGYPVTIIDDYAFSCCPNLKAIVIPDSVVKMSGQIFMNSNNLESITLPFIDRSLGSFFYDLGFEDDLSEYEIVIDGYDDVYINSSIYVPKSLKSVVLSDACQFIDDEAFTNCTTLTNVKIGKNVKTIGSSAFAGCYNIEEFIIPEGVNEIKHHAFISTKIKKITIPTSMQTIGFNAFTCSQVENIYYMGNPIQWSKIEIKGSDYFGFPRYELGNATIHYTYSETECDKHTYLSEDSKRCGVCGKERSSEKAEKPTQNTNSTVSKPDNTASKNETVSQENVNSQDNESDIDSIMQNDENTTGVVGETEPDENENATENTKTDNGEKDSNGWIWIVVAILAVIVIGAVVFFWFTKSK